ncbi:MAG: EamA family transporter, partial [bacterium]
MQVAGLGLIAVGVVMMALDSWAGASARQLLGDAFLLLASISWSVYGVLARRIGLPALQAAAIVAVFSACCFLPVYVFLPGKSLFLIGAKDFWLQAIMQGIVIGAVSLFVYTRAVAAIGPATTTLFTAAVPCITTLAAVPLLAEFPSRTSAIGVGVVTLGMIIAASALFRSSSRNESVK